MTPAGPTATTGSGLRLVGCPVRVPSPALAPDEPFSAFRKLRTIPRQRLIEEKYSTRRAKGQPRGGGFVPYGKTRPEHRAPDGQIEQIGGHAGTLKGFPLGSEPETEMRQRRIPGRVQ